MATVARTRESTAAASAVDTRKLVGRIVTYLLMVLLALIFMVGISRNFDVDWFLDGRRRRPEEPFYVPSEIETPPRPPMTPQRPPPINV